MLDYASLLEASVAFHGRLCAGQVLGVRLAMLGCRLLGVEEPRSGKGLIVFVEIDRCAADAIQTVTGCTLGRRTLKYLDYGKMAATFLDVATGRAVRVAAREDSRERAWRYASDAKDSGEAQLRGYATMPDDELFAVQEVRVAVRPEEMPGPPALRVRCDECGEGVNDGRHVQQGKRALCRACAHGAYYVPVQAAGPASTKPGL